MAPFGVGSSPVKPKRKMVFYILKFMLSLLPYNVVVELAFFAYTLKLGRLTNGRVPETMTWLGMSSAK